MPVWPVLVFHLLLSAKLLLVWGRIGSAVESGYSELAILGFVCFEDGGVLGVLLLVLLLGRWTPRLSAGLAGTLLTVYSLDLFLLHTLFGRLTLPNVARYAAEVHVFSSFVTPALVSGPLLILPAAWLGRRWRLTVAAPGVVLVAGCSLAALPSITSAMLLHDPYLDLTLANVLRLNTQQVVRRGVADETVERAKDLHPTMWARMLDDGGRRTGDFQRESAPAPRPGEHPNLILVISESLSRVDSKRSGGLFDRLSRLDAVAAAGTTFTELVANGSDTTQALAALLAGEEPFTTPVLTGSMESYHPVDAEGEAGLSRTSLVARARRLGYETWFLSNAPLRFQDNGPWLRSLGFDLVEGGEAPYYDSLPRYSFASPADGALFSRAQELLDSRSERPFLMVLLTVSLHAPYRTPELTEGESPLISALRYVDRTTSSFYETLERRGYFGSGYLFIVGDHRRMTPLEPREHHDFGLDSLGRVFGCAVGPKIPPGSFARVPLNHTGLFEIATDVLRGAFSYDDDLRRYNKGIRNRLDVAFTTHLLSAGRGLVLVRRPGREPYTVKIAAGHDLIGAAETAVDRKVAAYIVLRTHMLQRRQENGRSPPSLRPLQDCDGQAYFRREVLYRLRSVQRHLISAAPDGFTYDPTPATAAIESALGEGSPVSGRGTDGGPASWWNPVAVRVLDRLTRLSALDPSSSRREWLQQVYDLIALTHAFEILPHQQRGEISRTFSSLDRVGERHRIAALWSRIRRTFRSNLENPRTEELCTGAGGGTRLRKSPGRAGGSRLVAHQGGLSRWPSNSMEAFRYAHELGADGVEFDVRLSEDGEVFVLHDDRVTDPAGGVVRVAEVSSLRLDRLDLLDPFSLRRASTQSPVRLRELLRSLGGRLLLWIELKPDGGERLPDRVADLLAEGGLASGSVVVSSFSPEMLRPLRRRFPELLIAYESFEVGRERVEALAERPDSHRLIVSGFHFPSRSPEAFRRARELGLRTSSFTVNRFDALDQALSAGVDFIQTDRLDRALLLSSGG